MEAEAAAPCRHVGAPPPAVVDRVTRAIQSLAVDSRFLAQHGISPAEYTTALPAAIESLRGRMAASNADRREFVGRILQHMLDLGLITGITAPSYGSDTVYRVEVPDLGSVAVIQKGCPDGVHSSVRWSVPDWAHETYLWWLCSSTNMHPGGHISKGVNRLRQRFFSDAPDVLDGIIFHNELCGGSTRPCPKQARAVEIAGQATPPPCIYVMPERDGSPSGDWNWGATRRVMFPAIMLSAFGIGETEADSYVGNVGFQQRSNGNVRTTVTARFGAGRSTTFRN